MADPLIICTADDMWQMLERGEITGEENSITLPELFEFLCDYYGTDPHWQPNDVY